MTNKKTIELKIPNLNWWMVSTLVLLVVLIGSFVTGFGMTGQLTGVLSEEDASLRVKEYIENTLITPGNIIDIENIEEKSGVYSITTLYEGEEIVVYSTKDGEYLFLQALDMLGTTEQTTTTQQTVTCDDITKEENPVIEAYVVSYCPFGTQMQRILAKIVEEIPELADNIKVRYMGAVVDGEVSSMHGETEAQENLRQICIREEQSNKYWNYMSEFLKEGNYGVSLEVANIDTDKLDECMTNGDGIEYAQEDFDLQDEYDITGSPSLVMNKEEVSEFDFGGRTADAVKTLLCCGFDDQPSVCSETLTTQSAATGFTDSYSGTSGSGSC